MNGYAFRSRPQVRNLNTDGKRDADKRTQRPMGVLSRAGFHPRPGRRAYGGNRRVATALDRAKTRQLAWVFQNTSVALD